MDKAGELLLVAADLLQERGWCQGKGEDVKGRICLWTALEYTAILGGYGMIVMGVATDRLEKILGMLPIEWNDRQHRTKKQVVEKLREAAQLT